MNPRRQCWATSSRRAFRHARLFPFARGVGQPHAESTILNSWGAGEAHGGGAAGEVAINTCKILSINCSPATCGGYGSWQQRCKKGWHPVLPANGLMGKGRCSTGLGTTTRYVHKSNVRKTNVIRATWAGSGVRAHVPNGIRLTFDHGPRSHRFRENGSL